MHTQKKKSHKQLVSDQIIQKMKVQSFIAVFRQYCNPLCDLEDATVSLICVHYYIL